jgi:hypothetical protein
MTRPCLPTEASLKFYSSSPTNDHQEFMRERLALSSHQNNKRILLATSHQKSFRTSGLQIISIFILLPLCQQFNKKERKEERKLE